MELYRRKARHVCNNYQVDTISIEEIVLWLSFIKLGPPYAIITFAAFALGLPSVTLLWFKNEGKTAKSIRWGMYTIFMLANLYGFFLQENPPDLGWTW